MAPELTASAAASSATSQTTTLVLGHDTVSASTMYTDCTTLFAAADGGEMLQGFRTFSRMSVAGGPAAAEAAAAEAGPGERSIQRALYAGNFGAAVDAALEVRFALACCRVGTALQGGCSALGAPTPRRCTSLRCAALTQLLQLTTSWTEACIVQWRVRDECFAVSAPPGPANAMAPSCQYPQAERYADALGIAALPGAAPELFTKAQKAYMAAAPRPYMLLARCIMDQDFRGAPRFRFLCRVAVLHVASLLWHTCW